MATSNRQVPGLAPPYGGGAGHDGPSLASLIGAAGEVIRWPRVLAFFAAMTAADLVNFVIQSMRDSSPGSAFFIRLLVTWVLGNVVVAGAALLAFRLIRQAALAAMVAAIGYTVLMVPVRMATFSLFSSGSFSFSLDSRGFVSLFGSFVWQFLFLLGLVLLVPRLRPLVLGLGLGAGAGQVLAGLLNPLIWKIFESHVIFSFQGELMGAVYSLISAAVFAVTFWGGLLLSGYRGELEEEAAGPVEGVRLTGRLAEVQQAANFRMVRRLLRWGGVGSVVFGVVAVVVGAMSLEENEINVLLILIGVGLFAEGIWILVAPSPTGMIIDGIALIVLGLWNIAVTVQNIGAGAGGPHAFLILGVWQIIWGIQSFGRYRRFAHVSMAKPAESTLKWVEETAKALAAAGTEAPDVVEFQQKQAKKKEAKWKGRLLPDMAFFTGPEEEIAVGDRASAELTPLGGLTGGEMEAQLRVGTKTLSGKISQATVEKFQRWMAGAE